MSGTVLRWIPLWAALWAGLGAVALAAPRATLDVDSKNLVVGQTVSLQLQVTDAAVQGLPNVPVGAGLHLEYQGQSQSRVIVNFTSTRIVSFTWSLSAVQPGDWKVGPVVVDAGAQRLMAGPLTVHVRARSAQDQANADLVATLSDTHPYLGQVVVYRFRYRQRNRVVDAQWTPPDYDGFVQERVADSNQRQYTEELDGITYQVQEIEVPLVAAGLGKRTIPPAFLTAQVPVHRRRRGDVFDPFGDNFFGRAMSVRTETLSTQPIPVTIRPLPTRGKPADFSGLVGHFTIQAHPSATEVQVGDSVTIEVTLSGDGTLAGYKLPAPPANAPYRAYDDDPDITAQVQDGTFQAVATFRRAVVPGNSGDLVIDPIRISVFDPEAGRYVDLQTQPITLHVRPGAGGKSVVRSFSKSPSPDRRGAVASIGDDILPAPGDARIADRTLGATLPLALGLPALPGLALLVVITRDRLGRRGRDPRAELRRRLQNLPDDPVERLGRLEALFREALALLLGRTAAGLDREAVRPLGEQALMLYRDLEAARYGGRTEMLAELEVRVRRFVEERA